MALWIALGFMAFLIVAALIAEAITGKSYIKAMKQEELDQMMDDMHDEWNDATSDPLNPLCPYSIHRDRD